MPINPNEELTPETSQEAFTARTYDPMQPVPEEAETNMEAYIKYLYDKTQRLPEKPDTREEYFMMIAGQNIEPGSDVEPLTVTANGTYSEAGKAYSPVTVNVPLGTKSIINNGTYNASSDELAGYSSVTVNVSYDFDKKSLTNQPVASFDDAMNAPLYDLDIDIDPVQDLHGYANPWVGGAGKNKCGTFEFGTWMESSNVGTTYNNIKTSNNARFRSANLIPVTFPMTISIAAGYQYALIVFDANGGYLGLASFLSFRSATYTQSTAWYGNGSFIAFVVARIDGADITSADIANCHLQIEEGTTASSWSPYSNICPISGWTAAKVTACGNTYTISFSSAGTVYGGTLDVLTGELVVTHANIASYNGETINEPWISSMDVYSAGATPTTEAQVVYPLATPQTYQLTPEEIKTIFDQQNNIYADTGNVNNVTYLAVANE